MVILFRDVNRALETEVLRIFLNEFHLGFLGPLVVKAGCIECPEFEAARSSKLIFPSNRPYHYT